MKKRIGWIDGIKGIACLCVLWHHSALAFFPAAYYGNSKMTHTKSQIDVWLSQTPWAVFINGNYLVTLFCVLSAVILGLQVMNLQDKCEVSQILLKRYPRLMLPIAPIVFLVYIMLRYELFGHLDVAAITNSPWLESFYLEKVGLRSCVESLFITTWFSTDITAYSFWHIWGALLTVYGVWNIKTLQNWLEKPCFCFLGKISYSVYIIHIPLIYSFSMYVFQFMFHGANIGYLGSALGTIAVTTAAVIFLAWLYQRYVENGCNKILQIVFKRIKKQEKS